MAATYKILGQVAASATTETDLYTCPSATQTVVSTVFVCNRSATATTFRIYVTDGGGSSANKDYAYYDVAIGGNDTFATTAGIVLEATDKLRVYAGAATLSFSAYGVENA